jgi:hypothetical protein
MTGPPQQKVIQCMIILGRSPLYLINESVFCNHEIANDGSNPPWVLTVPLILMFQDSGFDAGKVLHSQSVFGRDWAISVGKCIESQE